MEVSSHSLAQDRVAGVSFDAAMFSNLTHDHLDFHGTLEAYFAAKARLFDARLKPHGGAALNLEDARVRALAERLPRERVFGFAIADAGDPLARVKVTSLELGASGSRLEVESPAGPLSLRSPLVGRFNVANVMAAVSAAVGLRLPAEAIRRGVAALARGAGPARAGLRQRRAARARRLLPHPRRARKALAAVREVTRGRLFCVFGCGGDRDPAEAAA